jgi:hypothetical protein
LPAGGCGGHRVGAAPGRALRRGGGACQMVCVQDPR